MTDLLASARKKILEHNKFELQELVENRTGLEDIFLEKQTLLEQMYTAQKVASDTAAAPFLEKIQELDKSYALLLSLSN